MTEVLNKKYWLEITTLSPLHIGAGSEKDLQKDVDYIHSDNKIFVLDHRKIEKTIGADKLPALFLNGDSSSLRNMLDGDLSDYSKNVFDCTISSGNDIKSFVKNGLTNKPVVPGSSIKGAIRSILFSYFGDSLLLNKSIRGNENRDIEKKIIGDLSKGSDFMRFIKISDAQFKKTDMCNTKIFNLISEGGDIVGGWKHAPKRSDNRYNSTGFNTIYECINPEEKAVLNISIADKAFNNFFEKNSLDSNKKKRLIDSNLTEGLFAVINKHTAAYIKKEIVFFEKYSNNETEFIVESLENILREIPSDNSSCVLKMSAGSGFHSITGDWKFNDYTINSIDGGDRNRGKFNGLKSAKSRKIATDGEMFSLMGFVKLSVLNSQEKALESELDRIEKDNNEILLVINERERIVEEKRQKEAAAEEKRIADKKAAVDKAKKEQVEREKRIKAAKEKKKRDKEEQRIRAEKNKKKQELENEILRTSGLSDIIDIDDFKKGREIVEQYFKALEGGLMPEENQKNLYVFIERCIKKSPKRWKKKGKQDWVLVKKWVGLELSNEWFDKLIK